MLLFHLALVGGAAAALFAASHRPLLPADGAGVVVAALAWAFTAALEHRIQPAKPATAHAADSPWRAFALVMLQLTLPVAALTARFDARWLAGGAALLALGAGLRLWSLAALGPHFTWTTGLIPGHTFVKTGPYRYLRHPNYLGSVLFAAGIALASGRPWAFVPVGLLAGAVAVTARHEAAYLRGRLPGYR